MSKILLKVNDLKMYYPVSVRMKGFLHEKKFIKAVDGINLHVFQRETFGVVGESGCGKSTVGKMIVKLLKPTEGFIQYDNEDIFELTGDKQKNYSRKVQIIFQDPYSSLDPRFTLGRTISEPLIVHKIGNESQRKEKVLELMRDVGLREEYYNRYPHEFSGGQRQRIGIARALALNPSLIVCDEPVSALDVSIQAQILNLMKELQRKYGLTYIFISHNLSVVRHLCDRIAVMYLGKIVEIAEKKDLFENPKHPYTIALLSAIPIPDPELSSVTEGLEGDVPSPMNPPEGCSFHTRCKYAIEKCKEIKPELTKINENHYAACHLLQQNRSII